jgi:outer membrane protein OmpA-like peptidoglycan-associated protein
MPEGKVETLVRVGQVKVGAEAEGYLRGSKTVELKSGDTVTVVLDLKPTKTKVQAANIDLGGSVFFETNKDIIKPESYKLLDEVASIMKEHPELKLVRIEGHTDSRGDDAFNLDLSQRRTEAVRTYLINKGVEANRLEAKGLRRDQAPRHRQQRGRLGQEPPRRLLHRRAHGHGRGRHAQASVSLSVE